MGISSAGIGSGLDVASIVNQLVAAERAPTEARIDRTERRVNGQISALGVLRSAFDSLRSAVEKLSADDTALARKVRLPEEPNFSASAGAGAAVGDYQVEVLALATAHKTSTGAYAASDTAVGTGTLTITSGETRFDIEIDSENNTLAGIRDAINKATDGKGVTATIINADDGAHLVFTATETGIANELSISASGGDGGLAAMTNATAMTELAAATDAQVKVNGFTRSSASNRIDDMLEGVTLTLTRAAPGTTQDFSVSSDASPLRGAAKGLVSAYNVALDAIAKTTKYDPASNIAAALNGDAMVRGISRDFRDQISSATTDLKALGITSDKDGKLTLDEAVFDEAIAENPAPATRLFSGEGSLTASLETSLAQLLDDDGTLDDRSAGLEGRTDTIQDQRVALDRRMAQVEERYRAQFTALDVLVSKMTSTSNFLAQQLGNLPGFS
ncbi:flagellar filament capping protein FliD [Novilysobacter erysipheiresistens]|uniref:Flagellar hook-associated protein 2 n=1 Tax=Novilysobacter erysipheiresistens TaxID=1749332 RepID=A0ABU7Z1F6_9GAMM